MTPITQTASIYILIAGCVGPYSVDSAVAPTTTHETGSTDTGTAPQPGEENLVDAEAWVLLSSSADPFPDHRTDAHTCDPSGVHSEDGVLEVETNACDYAVVGQPLLAPVHSGDVLELLFYHSALSSTEDDTEAHVFIAVDGHTIWDRTIPIPASSEVYILPQTVDWSAAAGSDVVMHLHNHGGNGYRFGHLKGGPPPQTTP